MKFNYIVVYFHLYRSHLHAQHLGQEDTNVNK